MGEESFTKRSKIQTISGNLVDDDSPRKGYKNLYNINKRDW